MMNISMMPKLLLGGAGGITLFFSGCIAASQDIPKVNHPLLSMQTPAYIPCVKQGNDLLCDPGGLPKYINVTQHTLESALDQFNRITREQYEIEDTDWGEQFLSGRKSGVQPMRALRDFRPYGSWSVFMPIGYEYVVYSDGPVAMYQGLNKGYETYDVTCEIEHFEPVDCLVDGNPATKEQVIQFIPNRSDKMAEWMECDGWFCRDGLGRVLGRDKDANTWGDQRPLFTHEKIFD